jgi:hypothetical protein
MSDDTHFHFGYVQLEMSNFILCIFKGLFWTTAYPLLFYSNTVKGITIFIQIYNEVFSQCMHLKNWG